MTKQQLGAKQPLGVFVKPMTKQKMRAKVYRFHDLVAFTLYEGGKGTNVHYPLATLHSQATYRLETIYLEATFCRDLCHSLMDVAVDIERVSFSHSDLKTVELGRDDKGMRFVGLGEGGPEFEQSTPDKQSTKGENDAP